MSDRPTLHLVDADTGEVHGDCPNCSKLEADAENLERELRAKRRRITELERERVREHKDHPKRPLIEWLHGIWRTRTGHTRSRLDFGKDSRFEAYLKAVENFPLERCVHCILGAEYDPWRNRTRNGRFERYDDATTIFKNASNVERMCNRAPVGSLEEAKRIAAEAPELGLRQQRRGVTA